MSEDVSYRIVLYMPRWHGWACWAIEQRVRTEGNKYPMNYVIHSGWMRRPKGSPLVEYETRDLRQVYPRESSGS